MGLFDKIFGTRSQREVKKLQPLVNKVLALESEYGSLSEEALKGKTAIFKERLAKGETLDDILPEAFAAVREAAWRVLGMKPYPVQIIGGIVLHQGRIAEMKTGEGKTLVATLPAYLNALAGDDQGGAGLVDEDGVHLVHDGEGVAPLDALLGVDGHVVPEVVEAQLVIGAVGDIRGVGNLPLRGCHAGDHQADGQA